MLGESHLGETILGDVTCVRVKHGCLKQVSVRPLSLRPFALRPFGLRLFALHDRFHHDRVSYPPFSNPTVCHTDLLPYMTFSRSFATHDRLPYNCLRYGRSPLRNSLPYTTVGTTRPFAFHAGSAHKTVPPTASSNNRYLKNVILGG